MANPTIMFALKATIKSIYPVQVISAKFKKATAIVSDQFGNDLALEAHYELADGMASFAPGTLVDINFDLSCNASKTDPSRWFTNAVIKSIAPQAAAPVVAVAPAAAVAQPAAQPAPAEVAPAPAPAAVIPF
jgi:hypothetical protein